MLNIVLQTSKVSFVPKYEAKNFNGKNFYIQVLLNHSPQSSEESPLVGVIFRNFKGFWVSILDMWDLEWKVEVGTWMR